jgi:mono/diheme cytochrome c family protein
VLVALAVAGASCVAACDQVGTAVPVADAGSGAASALVSPAVLERGEYVVRSVAGCGECHTPRDDQGNLDMSRWLGGVADRFDLVPEDDTMGAVPAPNLTPYGVLSGWTDDAIQRAFRDGVRPDGTPLVPLMPYYAYHNMSDADAAAVVAYLRAVEPVANDVPARQPLPFSLDAPAPPVPQSAIPHTTLSPGDPSYASAERGRYLAGEVGFCLDCHTPWRAGITPPLDLSRVFAGGRPFSAREWGVPAPDPAVIYSYDVTPDPTGIAGWTADDMVRALQHGIDNGGGPLCRPMPSGPFGGFGGMVEQDARDVGTYLTTIPPIGGGDDIPQCPLLVDAGGGD